MSTIIIPTPMRKFTNNKSQVVLGAGTITAMFSQLDAEHPGIKSQIYNDDGTIKRYINVFVNGRDIRSLDGEKTEVHERDEVLIVPAMAGG